MIFTPSFEQESASKRRKLLTDHSNERSPTSVVSSSSDFVSISHVDLIDDVLLHIMKYFIGKDGIDLKDINSVRHVCKRWNHVLSLPEYWSHVEATTNYSNENLQTRLAGFINLGAYPFQDKNVTMYKVKQRSTGSVYQLKIQHRHDCHPRSSLREIATKNKLVQDDVSIKHLSLIQDWCRCNDDILHWYEYSEYSLHSYLEGQEDYTALFRNLLYQCLLALNSLHRCGIKHRNLSAKALQLFLNGSEMPLIKISDFGYSSHSSTLPADNCEEHIQANTPESISHSSLEVPLHSQDCFALATVFQELLQYIIGIRQSKSISGNVQVIRPRGSFFEQAIDIMGKDGMDLLHQLSNINQVGGISTLGALEHPYFQGLYTNNVLSLSKVPYIKHETKPFLISTEQRASIVDWLFEIVTVFNKNTKTVYLAMEYLDKYLNKVSSSESDLKSIDSELQLIAATCLYIASKCNDDVPIRIDDLPFCADKIFVTTDILRLEEIILQETEWSLINLTLYDVVLSYLKQLNKNAESVMFWLSMYISDLALQCTEIHRFSLPTIAAVIITISLYSLEEWTEWSKDLFNITHLEFSQIIPCYIDLSSWLQSRQNFSFLKIIERRYSKDSRMHVASTHLILLSSAQLMKVLPTLDSC